ncbi:MAG TPA: hypothetical protein VD738_09190, partial [Nitrospira sp.]|nr:hypothetical protein [Nitrospira sp.]
YEEAAGDETRILMRNLSRAAFHAGPNGLQIRAERIPDVGSASLETLPVTLDACVAVEGDEAAVLLPEFARSDAYRVTVSSCDAAQKSHGSHP